VRHLRILFGCNGTRRRHHPRKWHPTIIARIITVTITIAAITESPTLWPRCLHRKGDARAADTHLMQFLASSVSFKITDVVGQPQLLLCWESA
jgi:hypothetical protein